MKLIESVVRGNNYTVYGEIKDGDLLDERAVDVKRAEKNRKEMDTFGETWSGIPLRASDLFNSLLAAYINDDVTVEFLYVDKKIESFRKSIQSYTYSVYNRQIPNIVITPERKKCRLAVAVKNPTEEEGYAYYFGEESEECILTRLDGTVATDMDCFLIGALVDDVEKNEIVYIDDDTKKWLIEEYGVNIPA